MLVYERSNCFRTVRCINLFVGVSNDACVQSPDFCGTKKLMTIPIIGNVHRLKEELSRQWEHNHGFLIFEPRTFVEESGISTCKKFRARSCFEESPVHPIH